MAVGVPEADVFAAADRVLERGERPTVERVRVELGRGSPARVGQLLEAWWDVLAKRLAGENRLPALPTAASTAFTNLWRAAVEEARAVAHGELERQRANVEISRAQFQADRVLWEQRIVEVGREKDDADATSRQAVERLEDLQRLTTQLERRAAEVTERHISLEEQLQTAERERRELQEHLAACQAASQQERETAAQYLRSVEDRGHAEIDRARQETKILQSEIKQADSAHQSAMRKAQQRESDLRLRLAQEERAASKHAERVRALEEQVTRLDGLGGALRSAQEAIREGLERETHLRSALEEKAGDSKVGASKISQKTPPRVRAKRP